METKSNEPQTLDDVSSLNFHRKAKEKTIVPRHRVPQVHRHREGEGASVETGRLLAAVLRFSALVGDANDALCLFYAGTLGPGPFSLETLPGFLDDRRGCDRSKSCGAARFDSYAPGNNERRCRARRGMCN